MRNYFEEMNVDYDELKKYEEIETYYDEIQDYSKLIQELQCDRVEALKQIVKKNKEIARLNKIIDELEKHLKYQIKDFEVDGYDLPSVREQSLWLSGCYDESKLILDKLKELKEEGK